MRRIVVLFLAMLMVMFLASCEHISKKPEPEYIVVPRPPVVEPQVDPIVTEEVKFKVLNAEGVIALAEELKATGKEVVIFVLEADGFRALTNNLVDIQRFIAEKQEAMRFVVAAANEPQEPDEDQ